MEENINKEELNEQNIIMVKDTELSVILQQIHEKFNINVDETGVMSIKRTQNGQNAPLRT